MMAFCVTKDIKRTHSYTLETYNVTLLLKNELFFKLINTGSSIYILIQLIQQRKN